MLKKFFLTSVWFSTLMLLQGCLLYYLFAPKTDEAHLPDFPEVAAQRKVYVEQCGRCHLLVEPSYFRHNAELKEILQRYRDRRILTAREAEAIDFYLRAILGLPAS